MPPWDWLDTPVQVWWLPTPNVTDEWTPAYYPFG